MIPGRVVRVRLSPRDCMGIADVVDKIEQYIPGMSFDVAVRLALSAALETFRANGSIPTRDGFEYTEMMDKYESTKADARRQQALSKAFHMQGPDVKSPMLKAPPPPQTILPAYSTAPDTPEKAMRRTRWEELKFHHEQDPINMSDKDMIALAELNFEFTPPDD
jgi:hypothetical protein